MFVSNVRSLIVLMCQMVDVLKHCIISEEVLSPILRMDSITHTVGLVGVSLGVPQVAPVLPGDRRGSI